MAKVSEYRCECGKQKTEANRWLLGWIGRNLTVDRFCCLMPWSDLMAERSSVLHFCSDKCALVWQQKEIEGMGR